MRSPSGANGSRLTPSSNVSQSQNCTPNDTLGCTNAIESLMAVLRQVCRNVKRWRNARIALRWTGTAMLEAKKTFHRLKAHKHLPVLRAALLRHQQAVLAEQAIDRQSQAA